MVVAKNIKIEDLDDALDKMDEYEYLAGESEDETIVEIEIDEDAVIYVYPYMILIPDLDLSVREGMYCYKTNDNEYMPDFSLSLIYELNEKDPQNWLYWEQDDTAVSLHNYLTAIGKPVENIYEYKCEIVIGG